MIAEAEIRRLAARWRVDPMILDLDYALGWFLAGLSKTQDASNVLRFKGGTCLRKCYFPGYRFSEDLDFTAIVVPHLAEKFWVRGVDIGSLSVSTLEIRRQEYEQSWIKQLDYLIPDSDQVTFEDAWQTTIEAVRKVEALLRTTGNRQENISEA